MQKATVYRSTGSWYDVKTTDGVFLKARIQGKFRNQHIKTTNPVAVGDLVDLQINDHNEAVIKNIYPRNNYIIRKSVNLSKEAHIIASNIDLAVLLVTVINPITSAGFIDRFTVTAQAYNIPILIVLNKIDIYDLKANNTLAAFEETYYQAGYQTLQLSDLNDIGVANFIKKIQNKSVLISGNSGAGKSTILNLIPRFYDCKSGDIIIDNQSIYETKISSLRNNISLVTQDTTLFDDTIKNNISYSSSNASQSQIEEAARYSFADEFINKLPNGIHTKLGKAGNTISVGQKQRISIARGLLRNTPIIILDEPTAALDPKTENKLIARLKGASKGKLFVIIAHRLSTVKAADQIIFIENGKIEDVGSHDELMLKKNGRYRHFVNLQNQ